MGKAIGSRASRLETKVCGHCGKAKPINQFSGRGEKKHSWCKLCLYADFRDRYAKRSPEYRARRQAYYQENKDKAYEYQRKRSGILRDAAIEAYGGYKCACCGETEPLFLTIDHVNNDGNKHRKEVKGTTGLLTWLKKNNYPKGFQVLCMNCNWGKARNRGVCPHKSS